MYINLSTVPNLYQVVHTLALVPSVIYITLISLFLFPSLSPLGPRLLDDASAASQTSQHNSLH